MYEAGNITWRDIDLALSSFSWNHTDRFMWSSTDDAAPIAIFGVPLDETTSFRPGTRFGPAAAREASHPLELYSLRQKESLVPSDHIDLGDLSLPMGSVTGALEVIRLASKDVLAKGKKFMAVGGEHLLTLPLVQSMLEVHPDLTVVQMDAHADLRQEFTGTKYSHGTVMRRIVDLLGKGRLFQLGIRSAAREELEETKGLTEVHFYRVLEPLQALLPRLSGRPVYLSIDIDVVDPAFAPGTGVPEPGGITSQEMLDSLSLLKGQNIVGADLVEVAPAYDSTGQTGLLAAAIVRECLLLLRGSR